VQAGLEQDVIPWRQSPPPPLTAPQMQPVLQKMYLVQDDVAHSGLVQRPLVQAPEAHTLPHAPQLLASFMRSLHWPLQVAEGDTQAILRS
jgi:hypothetical protein